MTLSDFVTYVKRDFKRTDKDTEIIQAYNDSMKWMAVKMPIGDYKFQSYVPTTVGIEDYELPCDLLHLFHPIRLLMGSNSTDTGYSLHHIGKEEYDLREPNPNRINPQTSRPSAYTVYSRSLLLTPPPDLSTYILEINWGKLPADQLLNADTTSLGEEYNETLKWLTLERLYAGLGLHDQAQYWGMKCHDQMEQPAGTLADLFRNEISREGQAVTNIRSNWL